MEKDKILNIVIYLYYYIGNIFYKLKYVDHQEVRDDDGEIEEITESGWVLNRRWYSWIIVSPILCPIYFLVYGILAGFVSVFAYFNDAFLFETDEKVLLKKEIERKKKIYTFFYLLKK